MSRPTLHTALAIAGVVIAILAITFAVAGAQASAATQTVEGETFVLSGTHSVVSDSIYSGGKALKINNTTSLSYADNITTEANTDITVYGKSGTSGGFSSLQLVVDGNNVGSPVQLTGSLASYNIDAKISSGTHDIGFKGVNVATGRNAFVDKMDVVGGGSGTPTPNPNLLTENQSSVETDLTGIAAYWDTTLTRDTTQANFGSASAKVDITSTNVTDAHGLHGMISGADAGGTDIVSANTTVIGSVYVKAPAGKTLYVGIRSADSRGAYFSEGPFNTITTDGTWQRVSTPSTTQAQDFKPGLQVIAHNSQGAFTFNVDGMKVEEGSTVTDWNLGTGGGEAPAQCADGLDNDGDLKTDFGANGDPGCTSATDDDETDPVGGTDPVFVGAGDIASCASTGDEATAKLLDDIVAKAPSTTTVYTTGDDAYESGTATEFANCYNPTWGRHQAITRPTVGNHEYYSTANASGYFGYFGSILSAAGDTGQGYYSYDLGSWHMIALNSNCSFVACAAGSAQEQWLKADLAAHPNAACTLAYWHHPRFSSGSLSGGNSNMKPFWEALYAAKADVVLNGHVHNYERFAPQTPSGVADPAQGIREFVVGTGGKSLNTFKTTVANSQVRNANAAGVLKLTLHPSSYDWEFVTAPGGTVADSGSGSCHS